MKSCLAGSGGMATFEWTDPHVCRKCTEITPLTETLTVTYQLSSQIPGDG